MRETGGGGPLTQQPALSSMQPVSALSLPLSLARLITIANARPLLYLIHTFAYTSPF